MLKELWSITLCAMLVALTATVASNGCAKSNENTLRVGVTSGPHAQIMEVVAAQAQKQGLRIKVVEFSDYVQPNAALADGSLDVNSFQHQPYLEQQQRDRGYRFAVVGKTVTFPIAAYSTRHQSLEALPKGAIVAIPNDPTNGSRALKLLEEAKLVRLRAGHDANTSPLDVEWSSGDYKFKELDAAQLARTLPDVDLAIINTNYAIEAGLDPFKGLLRESPQSPYANILVVRAEDTEKREIKQLVETYHSPVVRSFIEETFKGAIVPAW